MKDPLAILGKDIKKIRNKQNLSQETLSQILKVDKSYISRIEGGKINVTFTTLVKISEALTVNIKNLLKGQ